ncbi:AAA family ATPase [Cystobacter fuscus]|uniref:AAA family ATPase n=1 Tax=Cystobacter fuscus TaxID=43 RepID=UPI0037BE5407
MVKLQWLQVNKFRSVKPGTRLTFNEGHNVLLGQNGTGKTTLLNLIAAAIKSDFTDFKDEEFDLSYELASDKASASVSIRNENRVLPISIPSNLKGISALYSGALSSAGGLSASNVSFTAVVFSKSKGIKIEFDINGKSGFVQRIDEPTPRLSLDIIHPLVWTTMVLGLSKWCQRTPMMNDLFPDFMDLFFEVSTSRFDESLKYFDSLGQRELQVTQSADGQISSFGDLDPGGSIKEQITIRAKQEWGVDRYVLTDTDLPFLKRTVQLLDFESAEAIFELQDSTRSEQDSVMRLGNLRFYFRHRGGSKISEKMLSYGQKRMLAFMHYLASAKSTVVADELVNGLHHGWIRACFELLGERQVFLTSQNPLLLDYLGFQSPEDVRSTFVLCSWDKEAEQMIWENMSQEAAEDFFDSYKVGFQQVGELLQTKGLW